MIDAALRAIRLRQGREWIRQLDDLEGWPGDKRANALADLDATHGRALDALVESHRVRLWELLMSRDLVPPYGGVANARRHGTLPAAPPPPRARGIARALRKPRIRKAKEAQRDLFGGGA